MNRPRRLGHLIPMSFCLLFDGFFAATAEPLNRATIKTSAIISAKVFLNDFILFPSCQLISYINTSCMKLTP